MKLKLLGIVFFATLLALACKNKKGKGEQPETPVADSLTAVDTAARNATLFALTDSALSAFKTRNYTALSMLVHPDLGLRFSPYAFVDTAKDKVFTVQALKELTLQKKPATFVWGEKDATGGAIKLTMDQYIKEFVYDVDFVKPEKRGVDTIIYSGNMSSNIREVYPGCNFTESHFSGFDKKYEGMDWRSLRLVFKQKDGKYYLVGVVHDEWTT